VGGLRRSTRDWIADACITGVAAALGAFLLLDSLTTFPQPAEMYVFRDVAIGGVACVALFLLRRRWPAALALALIVAGTFASSAMGATAMGVFTVAVHRSWRVAAGVAGLTMALIVITFRLARISPQTYREAVVTFALLYAVLVVSGMLIRSRRQLVRSLQDRARQAEEGQRLRVEEARHLERERLAREMHDVLAHRISLLAVHAGALEFRPGASAEEARAAGVIRQCAYEAMEDLREVIGVLREEPGTADPERPQPTLTDLPELIEQSRLAGATVTLDDRNGELPAVPARVGRHAYRIVQEGLTNARKHAAATHVRVTVAGAPGAELTIEVANPLPLTGADAQFPGAGTGLIGLRERVGLVGGRLEHGCTPDGVFRLRAWLPWHE
jgi:signal transduction histidine kinase